MVRCLIIFLLSAVLSCAHRIVELDKVQINYYQLLQNNRPYSWDGFPGKYDKKTEIELDVNFMDFLIWENLIHSKIGDGGFRTVGWEFKYGFLASSQVFIFGYHHSEHMLDRSSSWINTNGVGVSLRIF